MATLVNHSLDNLRMGRKRPERKEAKAMNNDAIRTYWVEKTVEQGETVYFVMAQSWGNGDPVCVKGPYEKADYAWNKADQMAHLYCRNHMGHCTYRSILPNWARPTDELGTARAAWNVYVKESE